MTEICKCPTCGTEHVVYQQAKPFRQVTTEELPKIIDAMSATYQIQKAKEQGYNLAKCLETVMKGEILEQCKRANGFGLQKLYCKQHGVKHPEPCRCKSPGLPCMSSDCTCSVHGCDKE